jgi:hypothetical protein
MAFGWQNRRNTYFDSLTSDDFFTILRIRLWLWLLVSRQALDDLLAEGARIVFDLDFIERE